MLSSVYSEYAWLPWLFNNTPKGYWNSKQNQRKFFDWLAQQLQIRSPNDWYTVRPEQISKYGGMKVTRLYAGSLIRALAEVYPEYPVAICSDLTLQCMSGNNGDSSMLRKDTGTMSTTSTLLSIP